MPSRTIPFSPGLRTGGQSWHAGPPDSGTPIASIDNLEGVSPIESLFNSDVYSVIKIIGHFISVAGRGTGPEDGVRGLNLAI